jgi:hypothetical protein
MLDPVSGKSTSSGDNSGATHLNRHGVAVLVVSIIATLI